MKLYSSMLPMNLQYFAEEDPAGGGEPSTHEQPDNDHPDNPKGNNNPQKGNDNPGDGKSNPD